MGKKYNTRPTAGSSKIPSGTKVAIEGQGSTADLVKDTNQKKAM